MNGIPTYLLIAALSVFVLVALTACGGGGY
jgi:hypothetical protein